ncbi:TauD/TfdA dioxygenase family protein [Ramlibacter sp.]|uniref:TauD/TfdA dioxygenase family protein n=1 Tax=Ramlibacter sp. TaxID=1917967 RepID=UPI003D0F077A
MQAYEYIRVSPLGGSLGAEIQGVDASGEVPEHVMQEVRRAFSEHLVIIMRGQEVDAEQQIAFARRFGPLTKTVGLLGDKYIYMVDRKADDTGPNIGGHWHADGSQMERPPLGSLLYAIDVPPQGGDTMFCNLYEAYECLSPGMKSLADSLILVHSGKIAYQGKGHVNMAYHDKNKDMFDYDAGSIEAEHPLVRIIPETGRKALWAPGPLAFHFKDMTQEESAPLLQYFRAVAVRPELTCRIRWTRGALLLWDNRATYHYALNDYKGFARSMRRIQVEGERPYGPAMPRPAPVRKEGAA